MLEIDLLNEGPAKFQQLLMQKGVNLDGKQLQQQASPETYELTAQRAADLGVDLKLLASFKPWVVALTMVVMELQKLGYDPNSGIDHQLAQRAKQANKPVSGLETAEFQIDFFSRLSPPEQDMFLRRSLLEMDQLEKSVDDMVDAWNRGDVERGEKLFLESMRDYPELKTKLIDERNRRWIPQLEQFLKQDEDILVVVGAAHLVGKEGVIELLKATRLQVGANVMAEQNQQLKSIRVADWMSENVLAVDTYDSIAIARQLMAKHRVNQLPVLDNEHIVGIVTDRDIRDAYPTSMMIDQTKAIDSFAEKITVEEVMTHDVLIVRPDTPLATAVGLLRKHRIGSLPVVKDKNWLGSSHAAIFSILFLMASLSASGCWPKRPRSKPRKKLNSCTFRAFTDIQGEREYAVIRYCQPH